MIIALLIQTGTVAYWPDSKETEARLGPYTLTLLSMRKVRCMTVRNLRISFLAQQGSNREVSWVFSLSFISHFTFRYVQSKQQRGCPCLFAHYTVTCAHAQVRRILCAV